MVSTKAHGENESCKTKKNIQAMHKVKLVDFKFGQALGPTFHQSFSFFPTSPNDEQCGNDYLSKIPRHLVLGLQLLRIQQQQNRQYAVAKLTDQMAQIASWLSLRALVQVHSQWNQAD